MKIETPETGVTLMRARLNNSGQHDLRTELAFLTKMNEDLPAAASSLVNEAAAVEAFSAGRRILDDALNNLLNGKAGGFNVTTKHVTDHSPEAAFAVVEWLIPHGSDEVSIQIIAQSGTRRMPMNQYNTIVARGLIDLSHAVLAREWNKAVSPDAE